MNNLTAEERELAEDVMPEAVKDADRAVARKKRREYPKPTQMDLANTKERLEAIWHDWRYGTTSVFNEDGVQDSTVADGIPGLYRIRAMRYHRDQMPAKWRELLNIPTRVRSNLTALEIERTVALATRNAPKVEIKASSKAPDGRERADKETRWAQFLLAALERQAGEALVRMFADALFEGGMAVFEVYLTDAYDDLRRGEDESEEDYLARSDADIMERAEQGALPVGVRVPDPIGVLVGRDDRGTSELIISERKPYREVFQDLQDRLSQDTIAELRLPKPGDTGWPSDGGFSPTAGTPGGDVDTDRYYNRYWYVYSVGGKIIECKPHGFPDVVPAIASWGNVTSSSNLAEKIQGIAWGMVEQEQAINDRFTFDQNFDFTYGQPKPVIETDKDAPGRGTGPRTVDLTRPGHAPVLEPGERIRDAYGDFRSRMSPQFIDGIMALRQANGINPIASGEGPGSDPSGFAINSLQASAQMRYEILFDNLGRAIGMLIDLIRKAVKYGPIDDQVFVPVETKDGLVEFLGLGPDDISNMPANAYIDPMNDVNRLATRQSLIAGNQAGYTPKWVVQRDGFGADDPEAWDNDMALEVAESQMLLQAIEEAKARVAAARPPQLVGPDGKTPIGSGARKAGDKDEMEALGGIPTEPRSGGGEAGRMSREAGNPDLANSGRANAARARGGQAPASGAALVPATR